MFFKVDYAFYKSFVSGDLLLLGALLCIGIFVEIRSEEKHEQSDIDATALVDPDDRLDKLFNWNVALALFFGTCFLGAKMTSMKYDFPVNSAGQPVAVTITNLPFEIYMAVWLSTLGGIAAILWAQRAYKRVSLILLEAEIRIQQGQQRIDKP